METQNFIRATGQESKSRAMICVVDRSHFESFVKMWPNWHKLFLAEFLFTKNKNSNKSTLPKHMNFLAE